MPLVDKVKNRSAPLEQKRGPIWEGPESNGPQGGVTQSLLGKFLSCRKRFGLYALNGLKTRDEFRPQLEMGTMWHLCEEKGKEWESALLDHVKGLMNRYPQDREKVAHWYQIVKELFPVYIDYWKRQKTQREAVPLLREHSFHIPYKLRWSGRTVYLRGKMDGVDQVGKGKTSEFWLGEHKSKSSIDQQKITRQLKFDLQTMLYSVALEEDRKDDGGILAASEDQNSPCRAKPLKGVRYNVVRRSAHKTSDSMMKKVAEDLKDGRGGEWFARFEVPISEKDIETFRLTCLDPLLEWLCIWYQTQNDKLVSIGPFLLNKIMDYRYPYGVYNVTEEGGVSEYDNYLESGSTVGLQRVTNLFPELA